MKCSSVLVVGTLFYKQNLALKTAIVVERSITACTLVQAVV